MKLLPKIKMKNLFFLLFFCRIMLHQGTDLLKIFNIYIEEYTRRIDEEFGIDKDELMSLWKQVTKEEISGNDDDDFPPPPPPPPPPPSPSPSPSRVLEVDTVTVCPYVLTKGKKQGLECGAKSKFGLYCSRHKQHAGQSPKTKKTLPPERPSIISKKSMNIILHKGPGETLHHRPTGLVLTQDKIVIGRWVKALDHPRGIDEIKSLTDEDIQLAKKHMFPFKITEKKEGETCLDCDKGVKLWDGMCPECCDIPSDSEYWVNRTTGEDDHDTTTQEAVRKVTRSLSPCATKELQDSLSSVIAKTNEHATDVDAILSELQIRGSPHDQESEEVEDESDSDNILEEEY